MTEFIVEIGGRCFKHRWHLDDYLGSGRVVLTGLNGRAVVDLDHTGRHGTLVEGTFDYFAGPGRRVALHQADHRPVLRW